MKIFYPRSKNRGTERPRFCNEGEIEDFLLAFKRQGHGTPAFLQRGRK